jgi:hypothetical protein
MNIAAPAFASTGLAAFSLIVVHLRDAMRIADAHAAPRREEEERDALRAHLASVPFIQGDAGEALR